MPTPSATFRAGKGGRLSVNGSTLRVTQWSVDLNAESIDFANSVGRGYGVWLPGIRDLEFEIFFDYFLTDAPFLTFSIGGYVSNVNLSIEGVGPTAWSIPVGLITASSCSSSVRGKISGIVRGKATGGFIPPQF